MKYKIKHLRLYLSGDTDLLPKSFGVELVELGLLTYVKMTAENYNYWWYEVANKSKARRDNYTFDWLDLRCTKLMDLVSLLIVGYCDDDSMYNLVAFVLNIDSYVCDRLVI